MVNVSLDCQPKSQFNTILDRHFYTPFDISALLIPGKPFPQFAALVTAHSLIGCRVTHLREPDTTPWRK